MSMIRRVLQSSAIPRGVATVFASRPASTSSAPSTEDPLKGLIDSLSVENELSPLEKLPSVSANIASLKDLEKLLKGRKDHFKPSDFLNVLQSALLLNNDKSSAAELIRSCAKEPKPQAVSEMAVNDDLTTMMTALLDLGLEKQEIFQNTQKRLLDNLDEADLTLDSVLSFVVACNRSGFEIPKELKAALKEVLLTQMREVDSASVIIAVLTHWDPEDKEVSRAAVVRTIELLGSDMSCCVLTVGEMCSLMNRLAERHIRDKKLLPLLSARITDHHSALSVRQLVSLAASCTKLNYFDARVLRRLSKDLLHDVNSLRNWADVSSLVDSFSRLRLGEMDAWNALAVWVNSHANSAPVDALSIIVAGMARNGIEECRPAAMKLSQRVRRETAPSQNVWLSTIHSLAFFRVLTPELAESALNADFVSQLLQSSKSVGEKLYKAMKLLQISSCAEIDLGKTYAGPRVGLAELKRYIQLDDEATRLARLIKYGKKDVEVCNHFLSDVVFKVGSPSTHISPSCIDATGTLVDAQIVCEKDSTRLVPISKWGASMPRPIIFFGWGQTRQTASDVARTESNTLLGWDQLSLRLLRSKGAKPIIILHSDLSALGSAAEKVQFLKKRIADTS